MFQPDWLILRVTHQRYEIELSKGHYSEVVVHLESEHVLTDFSLTVKVATLIFISGRGSAMSAAKEGKSGFIYNLVKG